MTEPHKKIRASKGEAAGKLNRVSHIILICHDMNETVRFYRDVLGLKIVGTSGAVSQAARDKFDSAQAGKPKKRIFKRQYFFSTSNGEVVGFYEIPHAEHGSKTPPVVSWIWPGTAGEPPEKPSRFDHLAFNVDTVEEVNWFKDRLIANGVEVFGPVNPKPGSPIMFTHRIYFFDPSGNALEIATQNLSDPMWKTVDEGTFLSDTDPVPRLVEQ